MAATICPKGHESTETDFCSECGAKILGAAPSPPPAPALPEACPDCSAPRNGADFCEICGYNYKTGKHGEIPAAKPAPIQRAWELTVTIDASLRSADSPEPPANFAVPPIRLKPGANLIGRTSEKRAIHPEVALDHDEAVSHRHALLDARTDGGLFLRDIGSSNGTRLNGAEVKAMEDIELKDGDTIELGHWTRLLLKAAQ